MRLLTQFAVVFGFFCMAVLPMQCAKAEGLYLHTVSEHYTADKEDYNEFNLGLTYDTGVWQYGIVNNSHRDIGGHITRTFREYSVGPLDLSLGGGVAFGYERHPVLPFVGAYIDYSRIRLYIAPTVINIAIQLQ